jgi:hypothetical protein
MINDIVEHIIAIAEYQGSLLFKNIAILIITVINEVVPGVVEGWKKQWLLRPDVR